MYGVGLHWDRASYGQGLQASVSVPAHSEILTIEFQGQVGWASLVGAHCCSGMPVCACV